MAYRIQVELGEGAPLKQKVELHAKLLRHLQRRKLDADHRGKTNWTMQYASEHHGFTIIWERHPAPHAVGLHFRFNRERLMGFVVLKFSAKDIEIGGPFILAGDWPAIEDDLLTKERVV